MPARVAPRRGGLQARWGGPQAAPPQDGGALEKPRRRTGIREGKGGKERSDPARAGPTEGAVAVFSLRSVFRSWAVCAIQGMDGFKQQRINDFKGLRAVHQCGYLRAAELGRLVWPAQATSKKSAEKLIRSWIERRLVIVRELPQRHGRVVMLATAGVRLLAEGGVAAVSGKDIGQSPGQHLPWEPPATWRHDLMALGVLSHLKTRGWVVMPELELRRHAVGMAKLPDGLARDPLNRWWWLEVENARKSGPAMRLLADAVIATSQQQVVIAGIRPVGTMLAYTDSVSELGHQIDHRARVSAAVEEKARDPVQVMFARLTTRNYSVEGIALEPATIAPARHAAILKKLNASGWVAEEGGVQAAHYAGFVAYVWPEDSDLWGYQVEKEGWESQANYAKNISEAKLRAAELINAS